jgi:Mrp family chromosome partitioning ATPase
MPLLGTITQRKALLKKNVPALPWEDEHTPEIKGLLAEPIYEISRRFPTEIQTGDDQPFGRVLMVESATLNEGKTTVAINIAANLSNAGFRVLLSDCDLLRPSLHKVFQCEKEVGLGSALEKISTIELGSGTLKEYSIDDLFFLIELKNRNGKLTVQCNDQAMNIFFQNGAPIHIRSQNNPQSNRLGAMLLKGGSINREQLKDAIERHRSTFQPLGYILVNSGYVSRDQLRGPLRLQMEEHLQKLFSWKTGEFNFEPGFSNLFESERIFFREDYSKLIKGLGRIEGNKFAAYVLLSHIRNGHSDGLYVLPAGASMPQHIGQFNQILIKKVFDILKQKFDVVIIDTPPVDAAAGTFTLSSLVDGIVFVIKAGHLSYKIINQAVNNLPKEKIIGTVLNQVKVKEKIRFYSFH